MKKSDHLLDTANAELDAMVKEVTNEFLTDKFLGRCWHDWQDLHKCKGGQEEYNVYLYKCSKCGEVGEDHEYGHSCFNGSPGLFTWDGFGLLWDKVQGKKWFPDFWTANMEMAWSKPHSIINRLTFPTILMNYIKKENLCP